MSQSDQPLPERPAEAEIIHPSGAAPSRPARPPEPTMLYLGPSPGERPPVSTRWGRPLTLLLLLLLLLLLPMIVEQIQYAFTRGRERAEAEVALQVLESGHGATIADYRYVAKLVMPSVVGIKATRVVQGRPNDEQFYSLFGRHPGYRQQEQGSGVIVDKAGYIVTNDHVVGRANQIMVELSDGRQVSAKLIGADPTTDLAVLKIDSGSLTTTEWGDSDKLEVGDPVMAVGNPFGLARSVTAGIVSAKGRQAVIENVHYDEFLQTDAAVNPGNSGGPLVDMKGRVIGINTAIVGQTYQGISFAIPSKMVRHVYDQLVKTGKVVRGWLGVSMQELTQELAEKLDLSNTRGALVTAVVPGSPAAEAGIQPGDVIIAWNDQPINDPPELRRKVALGKIGEKATVTVIRGGKEQKLTVTVGERPERLQ